ncbi:HMA2 domain-containing protein [Desulfovibrio falkowii]|uniref:Cation transporter n=1 Tax=Desulfovibrio falkowii TaxID=3136602 RepID=A0ABQ0E5F2_9BACT
MNTLHLLRYVRSFVDGRVRIRHPALRNGSVAALAETRLKAIAGVNAVECNPVSGSVLILYDSKAIPKERLFAIGEAWAVYLDKVKDGKPADVPEF